MAFEKNASGFSCKMKIKPLVDPTEREFVFSNEDSAANYTLT
jgi:hypothetical protein